MPRAIEDRKRTLTRLRRIQGQCAALESALERGDECGLILQQIAAVRGGVNGLMSTVLEIHLREELGPKSPGEKDLGTGDPEQNADAAPSRDTSGVDLDALVTLVRTYLK